MAVLYTFSYPVITWIEGLSPIPTTVLIGVLRKVRRVKDKRKLRGRKYAVPKDRCGIAAMCYEVREGLRSGRVRNWRRYVSPRMTPPLLYAVFSTLSRDVCPRRTSEYLLQDTRPTPRNKVPCQITPSAVAIAPLITSTLPPIAVSEIRKHNRCHYPQNGHHPSKGFVPRPRDRVECWNRGYDYPTDRCFVRVVNGCLVETN